MKINCLTIRKLIIWSQTLFQILFPLLTTLPVRAGESEALYPSPIQTDTQQWEMLANSSANSGFDGLKTSATGVATGAAASSVQKWLNQFGTARVSINVDDSGSWDQSSVDLLNPFYDNKKAIWFTQLGLSSPDDRVTGNFGIGVRTFYTESWMFGMNVFFDKDFTGNNRRIGIGGESWTNYLKLSANGYLSTTNWHSSRDFIDYNEKPADGFDIRAEGYLPIYPQLGAKVMFEQYYGDEVALFDKNHRQSNPSAITTGISYTPVPLVSLAANYRRGQDSIHDTQFEFNIHYVFGDDWAYQLSPEKVHAIRSLAGNRYDLVERNNQIILQYKKKDSSAALGDLTLNSVNDNSPADGSTTNTVKVHAITTDGKAMRNAPVNWSVTGSGKLSTSTGMTDANGNASVNITNTLAEQVTVTAVSGAVSRSVQSSFIQSITALNLQLTKNNSQANGKDANSARITVTDASGKALSGAAVSWKIDNGATVSASDATTNSNGEATVQFTSTTAGSVRLSASVNGKTESVNSVFSAQPVSAVAMKMTTNNSPADGVTANIAQALITNASNQPMAGISVTWSLGLGNATATTPLTVTTDSNGIATLSLTDPTPQSVKVTASAGGMSGSTMATFVAATVTTVTVTLTTNSSPADGVTRNIAQAVVMQGKTPLSGTNIQWSKSSETAAFATSAATTTNSKGIATVELTDTTAEQFTVTATAKSKETGSAQTNFISTAFGPISISIPEAGSVINTAKASDGVDVIIAPYSGMAMGDQIEITSSIANDNQGKTLAYTSPVHTVTDDEIGKRISIVIPPENLLNVEASGGSPATLKVTANITKGLTTESNSLSALIDTCSPGQPCAAQ